MAYFFHVSGWTRSRHPAEWKRCCAQAVRTVWWIWKTCWGGSGLTLYCKPVFPPDLFRQVAVAAAVQVSDTFLDEARGLGVVEDIGCFFQGDGVHFAYGADNTCVFGVQNGVFSFVSHDSSTPFSFIYEIRSSIRYSLLKVCRTSYDGTMYPYRIPELFSRLYASCWLRPSLLAKLPMQYVTKSMLYLFIYAISPKIM